MCEFNSTGGVGIGRLPINISTPTDAAGVATAIVAALTPAAFFWKVKVDPDDPEKVLIWSPTHALLTITDTVADIGFLGTRNRRLAYFKRGYRMGHSGRPHRLIVILPYGTTDEAVASIREALRQRVGAGILYSFEVNQVP